MEVESMEDFSDQIPINCGEYLDVEGPEHVTIKPVLNSSPRTTTITSTARGNFP
jgi:hypothetical protein